MSVEVAAVVVALAVGAAGGFAVSVRRNYAANQELRNEIYEKNESIHRYHTIVEGYKNQNANQQSVSNLCLLLSKALPSDNGAEEFGKKLRDIVVAARAISEIHKFKNETSPEELSLLLSHLRVVDTVAHNDTVSEIEPGSMKVPIKVPSVDAIQNMLASMQRPRSSN